jgi:hypothetical protein
MLVSIILQALLVFLPLAAHVRGHGYQSSPRSRNWYANEEGIEGSQPGVPGREYCPHCLNTNNGVCGVSTNYDYDEWIDSQGNPMPWISQATYANGDVINVASTLRTHHGGHMEIKGCPSGRASTQECFDEHALTFVRDLTYDMPADPAYPERGYYYGGQGGQFKDFSMAFLLPDSLVGEKVLLQVRKQMSRKLRLLALSLNCLFFFELSGVTLRQTAAHLQATMITSLVQTRSQRCSHPSSGRSESLGASYLTLKTVVAPAVWLRNSFSIAQKVSINIDCVVSQTANT